ncbi:MAG TPA: superoxide dismutase [Lentimicrobium sp.]|nr:superoxide dismutase [Lentimicrobium sp.]
MKSMKMSLAIVFALSVLVAAAQETKEAAKPRLKPGTQQTAAPAKPVDRTMPAKPVNRPVPAKPMDRPMPVKPVVLASEWMGPSAELKFFELPYAYDALEPVIDSKTVEIHYDKHHRAYYTNFMNAIKGTDLEKMPITRIFANITAQSDAVRNNAGGYFNHVLYWQNLSPNGGGQPGGELADAINKTFGDFKTFTDKFTEAGKTRFGSGWAWLAVDLNSGELFITSTANQDNPLMNNAEHRGVPILALDVWEHAYYLKYQNKRADYITAFWNKVNWPDVEAKYKAAKDMREGSKKQ